jgi:hypothetical protein
VRQNLCIGDSVWGGKNPKAPETLGTGSIFGGCLREFPVSGHLLLKRLLTYFYRVEHLDLSNEEPIF